MAVTSVHSSGRHDHVAQPMDGAMPRWLQQTFDAVADSVPAVRHLVGGRLRALGLGALAGDLELVAAELVTNAIRHGAGPVDVLLRVTAATDRERVRLEVHDRGGGVPALRPPHADGPAIGGWGLRMVDKVADGWGVEVGGGRTVVWAELTAHR
jgi:anti-sigma regulatory factor (Ser/Thr protein kinase)